MFGGVILRSEGDRAGNRRHRDSGEAVHPISANANLERTARSDGTLQDFVGNSKMVVQILEFLPNAQANRLA